ncbi:MAG: hypothetical protein M3387_14065 [Actinomycetota bacterium]|nr:hypothetical protein [Actinomycetota bacterium]
MPNFGGPEVLLFLFLFLLPGIVGVVLMVYLFSLLRRIAQSNEEIVAQLRRVADRAGRPGD